MPVEVTVSEEQDLTVIRFSVPFSPAEFYAGYPRNVTRHVIYDFRDAGPLDWVNVALLREVDGFVSQFDHLRQGGRTAYLLPSGIKEILARLYAGVGDIAGRRRPYERRVFVNKEQALEWLQS